MSKLFSAVLASSVLLGGAAWAQAPTDDRPGPINDPAPESPIDRGRKARNKKPVTEVVEEPPPLLPPRQPGQGWLGWSVGSGWGWHAAGPLERASALEVESAFGAAALGHFGAEIGFQYGDSYAFSLQTRHQVIPSQASDPTSASAPKQWAHAVLARAVYLMPREGAQFYVGGVLGGGEGFRFRIDAQPSRTLNSSDTVRGGPVVVGPVGGLILPLLDRLSLVAEARILAGLPDMAAIGEINLGVQFDLFQM